MANLSQPEPIFSGEFRHSLDGKNRITIPARWRNSESDEFFLRPDRENNYLAVMPTPEFRKIGEKAAAQFPAKDHRVFIRHYYSQSQNILTDKQGRLVLPEEYCKLLNLRGEVVLVGSQEIFEIWNAKNWKRAQAEQKSIFEKVADSVGV